MRGNMNSDFATMVSMRCAAGDLSTCCFAGAVLAAAVMVGESPYAATVVIAITATAAAIVREEDFMASD